MPTTITLPDADPSLNTSSATAKAFRGFALFCMACAVIGFFTANGLITSVAFIVLPIITFLVWREGEPPVLLFGVAMQWLQATAAIFYTNHFGITLDEAYGSPVLTTATWLSIAAVLVLATGIRLAFIGARRSRKEHLEADAERFDIGKIGALYVVSFVGSGLLTAAAWRIPSITQPLLALAALKWAVVFLLCYTVLHQRKGYGILLACIGLEFGFGLLGIFASFKSVFFVLIVAALSSPLALRGRRLTATLTCFVTLFMLGIVWSAIKTDYRTFLADEASGPEDNIPVERRFDKLADLVESVNWDNFTDGIDALVLRVSYVNFFALCIENVPNRVPYENGLLWKESVVHVLTPRFLFPDKPSLDDSERTRLYTGVMVSGIDENTSIGIGYVGESYVDFGPVGMFAPILVLGMLYGAIYRFFVTRTKHKLLGSALAVSVLVFNAYAIESSNIKLLGGVVAACLVAIVVYLAFASAIMNYLRRAQPRALWRPMKTIGPAAAADAGGAR